FHLDPLTHHPQRPPPRPLAWLCRHGPRLAGEQQVIEGRPRHGREMSLIRRPREAYPPSLDLHLEGLRQVRDADEILHTPSSTAPVSTSAVCGYRSNARIALSR